MTERSFAYRVFAITAHNHHPKQRTNKIHEQLKTTSSSGQQHHHPRGTSNQTSGDQRTLHLLQLRSPGVHVQCLPTRMHTCRSPILLQAESINSLGGLLARSFRLEMTTKSVSLESGGHRICQFWAIPTIIQRSSLRSIQPTF